MCRYLMLVCGIALLVLGFADYHVEVGAIVVGLVLLGCLSGESFLALLASRPRPGGRDGPA